MRTSRNFAHALLALFALVIMSSFAVVTTIWQHPDRPLLKQAIDVNAANSNGGNYAY